MSLKNSALLLIGFQNDYFASDGVLNPVIEESNRARGVLENTLNLLSTCGDQFSSIIATPIIFTKDYSELKNPIGILEAVKNSKAFQEGTRGAETIEELLPYKHLIEVVPGKRGLNAFSNTKLHHILQNKGITHVYLAGAVTSICIDSTGRAAAEYGYNVTIISDCTSSRTLLEQDFFCEKVFTLYATVESSGNIIKHCELAL